MIVTANEIGEELRPLGSESYRRILQNHGVTGPMFGVKVEELKRIQKRVKKDYRLALDLFDTGIYDAMYLAGLIADDLKMSKKDLTRWVEKANSHTITEYTVARVAAESLHGRELALQWIESRKEHVAACGWATLSGIVAINEDAELDLGELKKLLARVEKTIQTQPNRVRYTMNGFVISTGSYVSALTAAALQTAAKVGKVEFDQGETACKLPSAVEYIQKIQKRGSIGKKRKTIKC
jgi:3-methyladenine DNA glycosylase AlkD